MSPANVLFASLFLPPVPIGGAETHGLRLAAELQHQGCRVTYVTARLPGLRHREQLDGVRVQRLPCFPWRKKLRNSIAVHVYWAALVAYIVRHADIDVCFSQGAFDISSVGAVIAAKLVGKKSIVKYGSETEFDNLRGFLGGSALVSIVRRADMHIANGPGVYSMMAQRYCLKEDKMRLIPNGITAPKSAERTLEVHPSLGVPMHSRLVVNIARFYPGKSQERLIEAWPGIQRVEKDVHLVLVGSGPRLRHCQSVADQLGLQQSVHFTGYSDAVAMFLRSATVFISPSNSEGCSNALLEAMAHGLPCVATDISANRAVISDGQDGLLYSAACADDLSQKLCELLDDPSRAARVGASARRKIESDFAIQDVARSYLAAFAQVMES